MKSNIPAISVIAVIALWIALLVFIGFFWIKYERFKSNEYMRFWAGQFLTDHVTSYTKKFWKYWGYSAGSILIVALLNEFVSNKQIIVGLAAAIIAVSLILSILSIPQTWREARDWYRTLKPDDRVIYLQFLKYQVIIYAGIIILLPLMLLSARLLP